MALLLVAMAPATASRAQDVWPPSGVFQSAQGWTRLDPALADGALPADAPAPVAALPAPGEPLPPAGLSAIGECGTPEQVSPVNLAASLVGTGCRTLVLAPGSYPALDVKNRSGGVLTIRCSTPGACTFATRSVVDGVDGLIIDGVRISGGSNALTIRGGSRNVLVRRSRFVETTNSGVLVALGTVNRNIQIHDNDFQNASLGCSYLSPSQCGHLADGSPIAEMDYGLRVYSTETVWARGNRFGTIFNHAISLKSSVAYAWIEGNTFTDCGRTCIELGQESTPSGEAVVTGNTFDAVELLGVKVGYIRKATVTGNTFVATSAKRAIRVVSRAGRPRDDLGAEHVPLGAGTTQVTQGLPDSGSCVRRAASPTRRRPRRGSCPRGHAPAAGLWLGDVDAPRLCSDVILALSCPSPAVRAAAGNSGSDCRIPSVSRCSPEQPPPLVSIELPAIPPGRPPDASARSSGSLGNFEQFGTVEREPLPAPGLPASA